MSWLGRFILWDYPRGSWQYDVMVGLILIFIFVTPHFVNFHDQPKEASISMVGGGYWLDSPLLSGVQPNELVAAATNLINRRYKTHASIASVEPIYDDEQELKGYMAFPKQ